MFRFTTEVGFGLTLSTSLRKLGEQRYSTQSASSIDGGQRYSYKQDQTYSSSKAYLAAFSSPGNFPRKEIMLWYVHGICAFLARSIPKAFLRLPERHQRPNNYGIGRWQCSHITRTILVEGKLSFKQASIIACRLLPWPDKRTTSLVGSSCVKDMVWDDLKKRSLHSLKEPIWSSELLIRRASKGVGRNGHSSEGAARGSVGIFGAKPVLLTNTIIPKSWRLKKHWI